MFSKSPLNKTNKRPHEESSMERPRKIPFEVVQIEDDAFEEKKLFQFRVLLPNGTSVELKMSELRNEMPIEEFIDVVRKEYYTIVKQRRTSETKRRVNWEYQDLHFTDVHTNKIRIKVNFRDFIPNKWNFLWLHDGSAKPDAYEGMWDLTPDTDLLKELPDDYTFETALADLIDNSLQALWSNGVGKRRLISVELLPNRISIFDSGPGMDGTDGNLVKWGKMGASLHRSVRAQAIGGEPPYLMPFFGMFGYGGPVATMCLGRRAVVSSKTRNSNKVFTLHLEREALVSASCSENCWRTKGGVRDPHEDEKEDSPHGSFTKVEIFEPKVKILDIKRFRCKLKDIYFPYIQCDEVYGKTSTPIEFQEVAVEFPVADHSVEWKRIQVNGITLAEIEGGEVATTNLHSCHGPDFILQLHFSISQDSSSLASPSQRVFLEANARLKCVYFPIVEGEESIKKIMDRLDADDYGIRESYESFSHVSVRRLGRLLPDARWALLPFMEPKQKKGEKAQILKRNCSRVKCFIDTDSVFNPTPHKTDLAHHHPYTKALKNFGNRTPENEKEVQVEIFRDGKKLTLTELEKQYNNWISEMHDRYDEEIDGGLDQPTIVVVSSKIKKLDLSSDVLRVHKKIQRKGTHWIAGQKIKVLKGACAGCHKTHVFATLEYIILEGLPGDACGEARLICRPLGLPTDRGCQLLVENGNNTIDIRDSLALPIRVIDSEKCIPADDVEWGKKLEVYNQKLPSTIDLLSHIDYQQLEIEGGLPALVEAGDAPPESIVAVIRPKFFNHENSSKRLDQKFIVRDNLELTLEIQSRASEESGGEFDHIFSTRLSPSSQKGLHGLYLFPLRMKLPMLFQKAGFFTFSFSLMESRDIRLEQVVQVQASAEVGRWKVVNLNKDELYTVRVGSCFKPLSVACYDRYNNRIPFTSVPKLTINLSSSGLILAQVRSKKVDITPDKSTLKIKEFFIKSSGLDDIRPNYEATLNISTPDEAFSVAFPCRVTPGSPYRVNIHPPKLRKRLIPGQIIEELALEVFDEYGNHVKEDETILLRVEGFSFQDGSGVVHGRGIDCMKKVDAKGRVDLRNTLKVSKGYSNDVLLRVISKERVILKLHFQTERRELISVQKNYETGSHLENIVFEITDSQGKIDESINDEDKHGQSHTLIIKSTSFDIDDSVRYSFRHGRCTVHSIPLPHREGIFSFTAVHSHYPELNLNMQAHVEKAWQENRDNISVHEEVENPLLSSQRSCEHEQILLQSPPIKASKVINETFSSQCSNRYVSPISSSPALKTPKLEHADVQCEKSIILRSEVSASQDLGNLADSVLISQKELEEDLANSGMKMFDHERKLEGLSFRQLQIQQDISDLQASIDRDPGSGESMCGKQLILKQLESRSQSAAAVICKMLEEIPFELRPRDIMGVVALLGTVESIELSRMLSQYLGEDQMLAIVCRNYAAAYYLETTTLHKFATEFGQPINGGYHALCLEDIRPSFVEPSSDPQQLLHLQMPTLPNGNTPPGFMGYAVNLICIESSHLQWRTKSGHGLRETLFFRLFGELQVYEGRECMMMAQSCIKDGALSLDGCIMRGNGLISLGHWEPEVLFPVTDKALTLEGLQTLQLLEAKKSELVEINKRIDEEKDSLEGAREKFIMSRDNYNSYVSQNGSS